MLSVEKEINQKMGRYVNQLWLEFPTWHPLSWSAQTSYLPFPCSWKADHRLQGQNQDSWLWDFQFSKEQGFLFNVRVFCATYNTR
jgi:hypothetical protein